MSELWGWQSGDQQGTQQNQANQMFGLTMAEGQQKLAEGSLTIQEKQLALKTGNLALQQQEALMRAMQARQSPTGQPASPTDTASAMAEQLFQLSQSEMEVGRFDSASKHARDASTILENNNKITAAQTKVQVQKYKDVSDLLGGATDSKGWDNARQLFQTLHPDEAKDPQVARVLQMPYSPQLVKALQDSIETQKDKAEITAAKARAVNSQAQAREADYRTKYVLPKQVEATEARIDHLKKAGAGNLTPKPADINDIVKLAVERIPDAAGDEVQKDRIYNLSREVAATAKEYEIQDGLPRAQAQDKAFQEAWDRKHYAGMSLKGSNRIGTTADNPLPVPTPPSEFSTWDSAKQTQWAAKNLKQNMYYITNKGLAVWNGSGFDTPDEGRSVEGPGDDEEESDE